MIIFYNANIYAPKHPGATALAIQKGRFIAIGSDEEIVDTFSRQAKVINLRGMTLWPGLTDAHIHLRLLAESMGMVDCETGSRQECLSRIEKATQLLPDGAWLRGHGWNQNTWTEGFGTAAMLDVVSNAKPAYLTAKSLHAGWANNLALQLAGIDAQTPDPTGGEIQRDEHGLPTGILFEAGAMQLVERVIPKPTLAETILKIQALLPELYRVGLVGVHDFDDFLCWQALQAIYQDGTTSLRIRKHIPFDHLDGFINAGLRTNFGDDSLHLGGLKLFSDGALGPQTAAMMAPYEGTQSTGDLLLTEDELLDIGIKAVSHGISLAVHAIGDRANHVVLNAFERIKAFETRHHLPRLTHRIEHVQIIDPRDLPRLAKLDIVASMQPIHAPSDMLMADRFLGGRAENAYATRSVLTAGAICVFGSDAPVEPFNPFIGLHAAVTRRRLDGSPSEEGWFPLQKLTLEEALHGFTQAPALISGRGHSMGRIAPGYQADFVLLETDPFNMNQHDLREITPLATFIAGECKHSSVDCSIDLLSN